MDLGVANQGKRQRLFIGPCKRPVYGVASAGDWALQKPGWPITMHFRGSYRLPAMSTVVRV